ncbi:MAG: cyclase family protein, partial [Acidimicrobiales bacterium]
YGELPVAPLRARHAWGVFGEGDSIGRLNLLGPARVLEAVRLVKKGSVFPLDAAVDAFDPPLDESRARARHRVIEGHGTAGLEHLDDVLDDYFPQVSSQWDSLAHIAAEPDRFYNGATRDDVLCGRRNTIDHWHRQGIVTRGVLLDVSRAVAGQGGGETRDTSHGPVALSVADLERARALSRVEYSTGCIILVRTGFVSWYARQPTSSRQALPRVLEAPGLEHSEEMARYLWDSGAAAVASDTFAVEVWPPDWRHESWDWGFLHRALIGRLGLPLGELWDLEALSEDCDHDGTYEFLVASAPLHVPGGIGSPANALAVK